MIHFFKRFLTKKALLTLTLFAITFGLLAFSVKELWFREDDLGVIINGMIRSWDDFIRVFSADERSFACPVNYLRSKPNVLSGFARPLKNIFFSLIYFFQGLNVHAYYYLHVLFHAFNVALFFHLLNFWVPLSLAFLGGLMFAFAPDISWFTWIATFHNSLAVFFILLSLIFYRSYWVSLRSDSYGSQVTSKKTFFTYFVLFLSGFMFFLSLISRENGIFLPCWLFSGFFLYYIFPSKNIWFSFKNALIKTWIFFFVNMLYVLYRLAIFGVASLDRTYNNLFLRFPFLSNFFSSPFPQSSPATKEVLTSIATEVTLSQPLQTTLPIVKTSLWDMMAVKMNTFTYIFFKWSGTIFSLDQNVFADQALIVFLWSIILGFLYIAYKSSLRLFLFFFIGLGAMAWPGVVAYPNTRYINCFYPVFIAMIIFGIYHIMQKNRFGQKEKFALYCVLCLSIVSIVRGAKNNTQNLRGSGVSNTLYKQRYERFFQEYTFAPNTNFVLLGCPFASDVQNIFQYFLNDFSIKLVDEPFSYVAQQSSFSCRGPYRIKGVKRKIQPIEGGYRFISQDKKHCACWMTLSDHPLQWKEDEMAYRWKKNLHEINAWHPCSIGKFKIHERLEGKYVTDISFIFDKKWIDKNTVVVSWDTVNGKYAPLNSSHLKNEFL